MRLYIGGKVMRATFGSQEACKNHENLKWSRVIITGNGTSYFEE